MDSFFFNRRKTSAFFSTKFILNNFNVQFTESNLKKLLDEHVDYPSFWTLSEVLKKFGVKCAAIKKNDYRYSDFEIPFICTIQKKTWGDPEFTVVTSLSDENITYLDPKKNIFVVNSLKEFENIDGEVILLIDGTNKIDEADLMNNKKKEIYGKFFFQIPVYFLLIFILGIIGSYIVNSDQFLMLRIGLSITSIVGFLISLMLIWHDIDSKNPFIREICGGFGRNVNCDAVLLSKGAKFLGISWSIWGGSYFFSLFTSLFIFNAHFSIFSFWGVISFFASFYTIYSIYYQWKVVKQWCFMCLGIQFILLINVLLYIVFVAVEGVFVYDWFDIIILVSYVAVVSALFSYIIPIVKLAKNSRGYEKRWKRLRYDRIVFDSLLSKSPMISFPIDDLGIVIGNPHAQLEILKVCNPYCTPCSRAHLVLERIIKNNSNIKVRIIFTASGEFNDLATLPVAHILAIYKRGDSTIMAMALDEWYTQHDKNYQEFASKYPVKENLEMQIASLKLMNSWCKKMKIRATHNIFINGRELPEGYKIEELEEILV